MNAQHFRFNFGFGEVEEIDRIDGGVHYHNYLIHIVLSNMMGGTTSSTVQVVLVPVLVLLV